MSELARKVDNKPPIFLFDPSYAAYRLSSPTGFMEIASQGLPQMLHRRLPAKAVVRRQEGWLALDL